MSNFSDYLKQHINKKITICLDDQENTLNDYKIVEVGADYVTVIHASVNRTIPINKITYIQELE